MQSDEVAAMIRLVCLPYAGGGTAPFYRWRSIVPADIELVPLALPGHDGRLNEPRARTCRRLLTSWRTRSAIRRPIDRSRFWATAWASLLAFEIARSLRRSKRRQPCVLILSACRPPHAIVAKRMLHAAPDAELVATLQERYGGIPAAVLQST